MLAHSMAGKYLKSLTSIVATLIICDIPPGRLLERPLNGPHPELQCRNRACPTFGTSQAIQISSRRPMGVESYCSECGSRFMNSRMFLSFDREHGSPDLHPVVVRRARAKLAQYHAQLAEACAFLLDRSDMPMHIDHVFHMAQVPMASYLRARRLGLVASVRERLGRGAWVSAST